jgi:hypothetical protein|tara:strand:- start:11 stop:784 length:774 start_codon:yes stop_codon:yes gene_type:complete
MVNSDGEFNAWHYIDWDIDAETLEFDLHIIAAWNKHNPEVEGNWTVWPEIEELIRLPTGKRPLPWKPEHPLSDEEVEVLKQHWLRVAQLIHEAETISIDEDTFTIQGNHGTKFSFAVCLDKKFWSPSAEHMMQALDVIRRKAVAATRHLAHLWQTYADMHPIKDVLSILTMWHISHDAGDIIPSHMDEISGMEHGGDICIVPSHDVFPLALETLIRLLIDDDEVWRIARNSHLDELQQIEDFDEQWPGGRPEDWRYL